MIRVAVAGAAGRMGRELIRSVANAEDMELASAAEAKGSTAIGKDAGTIAGLAPLGVPVLESLETMLKGASGVIDFTLPHVTVQLCSLAARLKVPMVIGTTGLDEKGRELLFEAARTIPIVFAPNMSVGVNVLLTLAGQAARLLGSGYDLEIIEAHHRRKIDAPSGTALRLAQVLAESTADQGPLEDRACYGRQGTLGQRPSTQIGIQTVRGGDVVGEHTVFFFGEGERIELTHRASSRQTFAQGALRALRFCLDKAPGLYDMQDVLGLS